VPDSGSYPKTPESSREPTVIATGTAGALASALKIISGLTNEKILILVVAGLLVWGSSSMLQTAASDRINSQRMYDDSRERDRQHCDTREDKVIRDSEAREKEMRAWFAAQFELQRKAEDERREKDRQKWGELLKGKGE